MSGTAWSKFFWSDWESDPSLRQCSPGAQGLWMRMLCICSANDGYLMIAGNVLSTEGIARHVGWPLDDVKMWMEELERWGVFSRDRRGCIYSRRMVRDEKKARIARENGRFGGNPTLRKQTAIPALDNQPATDGLTEPSGNISQKPEARVDVDTSTPVRSANRGTRISPEWEARENERQWARKHGWSEPEIDDVAVRFRDYWLTRSKNATKLDWDRAFLNRLKDLNDQRRPPIRGSPGNGSRALDPMMAAFQRKFEQFDDHDGQDETETPRSTVPSLPAPGARGH